MAPLDPEDERAFWEAVTACLRELHHLPPDRAEEKVLAYRKRLETPSSAAREMVYHNEPFNLACDLVGKQLNIDDFAKRYEEILAKVSP